MQIYRTVELTELSNTYSSKFYMKIVSLLREFRLGIIQFFRDHHIRAMCTTPPGSSHLSSYKKFLCAVKNSESVWFHTVIT
jgi:hypothetical protein